MAYGSGMALPKPAKRPPKPRRGIRRLPARAHVGRVKGGEAMARRREVEREADKLASQVALFGGPRCCRCHARQAVHPHHMVSRRYRALRWNPDNLAPLCAGCHLVVGYDSEENRALAISRVGAGRWEAWQGLKNCGARTDPALAIVALRARLEELRRDA